MRKISYNDWEQLLGKRLRVAIGGQVYTGELVGLEDSVVAVSATVVARPWKLRTSHEDVSFHPEAFGVTVEVEAPQA